MIKVHVGIKHKLLGLDTDISDATGQALGGPGQAEPTAPQTESERAEPASAIDTVNVVRVLYMYHYIITYHYIYKMYMHV